MPESYWEKREKNHIKREQMKDEEVAREIERIIQIALLEAEKEIHNFYSRYAGKRNLTPVEAEKEISEFDVQAFETIAAKYVKEKNFSDKANKELYTYNTKMRISRQELLMMYLNAHLVAMADEQVKTMQKYFEEAAMSEVARQAGILGANIVITQPTLLSIVGASFHGAVWSARIWDDMAGLREELDRIITSSIIRGAHPDKFIKDIRERFGVSTFNARRLLITEVARVQTEAQKISYQKLGDEDAEYRFIALMDDRTTKTCKSLNSKRFKVKDMIPGVNAPPMHPFCRSSTALDLGDWRTKFFEEKRKTYSLPMDKGNQVENSRSDDEEYKTYPIKKSNVRWNKHFDISEKASNILNGIHTELNEFMNKNRREKLFLFNKNTNDIVNELEGNAIDQIDFTKDLIKVLKESNANSLVLAHVHPSKTPFSRYDIKALVKYNSISELTLESADGGKYLLTRDSFKSSYINKLTFDSKYEKIYWNVAKKYPDLEDEVKRVEIWDDFMLEVNKEVANFYGMKFKKVE
ncbi:minor capsid protein [Virgibacillus pantothenticus]|uniref:minor capsid protein n=1 Tax=Virgibacillus pantothenticus TaxID=1473 RepID=UPI001C2259A6|nr:minor capsid protein [Virgibacillus pantothenticus]MBU8567576.1 minor capsid protein [Virgibacillus pantothenticus]MBU8601364.1 minor capsid protein [Virgibacillus pantothenticus]MBU8636181.1 minor capsid protein [Virgibacillus pantothenticus]MBU8643701.1 minor capsid protein [Virgibacillus pantothenticus]MBU8648043.1 minor capsid protein [Virgibacillus pantothenticus]